MKVYLRNRYIALELFSNNIRNINELWWLVDKMKHILDWKDSNEEDDIIEHPGYLPKIEENEDWDQQSGHRQGVSNYVDIVHDVPELEQK